jgi:ATP-binding protein involved in chromosome partitioning
MLTVEKVMNVLRSIKDPELNRDIVSMDMIKDLTIEDGKVSFTLELTTPACPYNSEIEQEVREKVKAIESIDSIRRVKE